MNSRELGKVTHADIEIEDHGMLTFQVLIDFGGSTQGFGGYHITGEPGTDLIMRLLTLFGARRMTDLKGRAVYALRSGYMIDGLELPKFDGGEKLLIADWREKWFEK